MRDTFNSDKVGHRGVLAVNWTVNEHSLLWQPIPQDEGRDAAANITIRIGEHRRDCRSVQIFTRVTKS
jgi:hypothetical protein